MRVTGAPWPLIALASLFPTCFLECPPKSQCSRDLPFRAAGLAVGGFSQISSTLVLSGPELKDRYLSSPCFTVYLPFFFFF